MAQQNINLGTTANDGTGDKLNVAFGKVQANFTDLYQNKEPKIPGGSFNQYFNGDKTFQDLNVSAVVGLQAALDLKVAKGGITGSGLTLNSGVILGRVTTGSGAIEALDPLGVKTLLGLDNVSNTSDAQKPVSSATQTALGLKQDALPSGSNSQFLRGDKTFVAITKSDVGLNAVDNTADSSKPVFQATVNGIVPSPGTTAYNAGNLFLASNGTWVSAAQASGGVTSVNTRTGDVVLSKSDVGLANVNNTSDANKPISTATQTALDNKSNVGHTHVTADITDLQPLLDAKEAKINPAATSPSTKYWRGDKTWQTLDKSAVGLDQVDNTSDLNKPVFTQTNPGIVPASGGGTTKFLRADGTFAVPAYNTQKFSSKFYWDGNFDKAQATIVSDAHTVVIPNSIAVTLVAPTADATLDIMKNGTIIGNVVFTANATTGTISIPVANDRSLVLGDILEIKLRGTADATLNKVGVVLHN